MVRSASLALAFALLLPTGAAEAQQARVKHIVNRGETLATLATRYLGSAARWTEIAALNPEVTDPNSIEVGLELVIPAYTSHQGRPSRPGTFRPEPPRNYQPVPGRSIFYDPNPRYVLIRARETVERVAVPTDAFYSAAWIAPERERPAGVGVLRRLPAGADETARGLLAQPFERMIVMLGEGYSAVEGDELQVFHVLREMPGRGWVVKPTGSVTVLKSHGRTAEVEVARQFGGMAPGDRVGVMPSFPLNAGELPEEVDRSSLDGRILGWAQPHQLQHVGDVVFLDVGSRDGVRVGDEFEAVRGASGPDRQVTGRLQVLRTGTDFSSARILQVAGPVLAEGLQVFVARKMP